MSDNRHYGRAYHDPHPDTLQAFFDRGVFHLCDAPGRCILNDPNKSLLVETSIRREVEAAFPELSRLKRAELTAERLETARLRIWKASALASLKLANSPKPKKGARRRDVPINQPLRPQTLIIAGIGIRFREAHPELSTHAVREEVAKFLSQGLRDCDRDEGLEIRSIRSAEDAFYHTRPSDEDGWAKRVHARYQRRGKTHDWDRNELEFLSEAERDLRRRGSLGGNLIEACRTLIHAEVIHPLMIMYEIYLAGRTDAQFSGLRGARLADAIDSVFGFERIFDIRSTLLLFGHLGLPESAFIADDAA